MSGTLIARRKASGEPFELTHSMVIDAAEEGITVTDNALYPKAADDLPFSVEFWHKTPASINASRVILTFRDTNGNKITFQHAGSAILEYLLSDGTNAIRRRTGGGAITTNTWYLLVITYSGSKAATGLKIYRNTTQIDTTTVNIGTYTGLPNRTGDFILQIPNRLTTFFGAGKYSLFRYWHNYELTTANISTLYNAGDPIEVTGALKNDLKLELLMNNNANARIGTDGAFVGSPTFDNADLP